jgi:hypothetical protein
MNEPRYVVNRDLKLDNARRMVDHISDELDDAQDRLEELLDSEEYPDTAGLLALYGAPYNWPPSPSD